MLDHLSEAQGRAYSIADNKLTELGGWDEALLLEELRGLMAEDVDLGLIGIPEPTVAQITRPGDIWALGAHRLICGDATDVAVAAQIVVLPWLGLQASLGENLALGGVLTGISFLRSYAMSRLSEHRRHC